MPPLPINKRWVSLFAVLGSIYYASNNYSIDGLDQIRLLSKTSTSTNAPQSGMSVGDRLAILKPSLEGKPTYTALAPKVATETPAIRVGSFNLHLFGSNKISKPHVMESLAKICRKFDVLALQEINGREQDLLPLLVQKINQSGRRYDYLIGPRVGPNENKMQLGFLFDTDRIETDRFQLYTVDDPLNLMVYEPLVAWFRTKESSAQEAFTFTAINLLLDSNHLDGEIRVLPELLESIQRDGRHEDDCLLLGDFGTNDLQLGFLRKAGLDFALQGIPTTTRGNTMEDNILFPIHGTDEYTGRAGAFDFLREFNLSIDQALEVSDHLPVWAEFFAIEGGQQGRIARTQIH